MNFRIERPSPDLVVVEFGEDMEALSTVPLISKKGSIRHAVFKRVPEDFNSSNVLEFYEGVLEELGLGEGLVFLTAANLDKFRVFELSEIDAAVFATAALKPATCLEAELYAPLRMGTINIAAAFWKPLSRSALADLLKTVAEAKALASSEALLRCASRPSGTVSDALAVLKPMRLGEEIQFAGMSTTLGNAVAKAVHSLVLSEASRESPSEALKKVLGFSEEEVLEMFGGLYSRFPIPGISLKEALDEAKRFLEEFLEDPNVWSLAIAARELDLHGRWGAIPGLSSEEFREDSVKIVADEALGISLSLYLAGLKGLFSMYWVERLKKSGEAGLKEPEMFEDDILSAILGSLYTLVFESLARGKR